jgi:hypothetical protein
VVFGFPLWTGVCGYSLPVNLFDKKLIRVYKSRQFQGPRAPPSGKLTMTRGWVMDDRYISETAGLTVMGKSVTG